MNQNNRCGKCKKTYKYHCDANCTVSCGCSEQTNQNEAIKTLQILANWEDCSVIISENQVEALTYAIKGLQLMPELTEVLKEIATFGIKDASQRQRIYDVLEKVKELI